ncbi:ribosomal L1 domain-containing protein 1 [Danio rerio]|uniref:Ribosomal L1 domain-containing protein 1 n=1 Tax=Danio rerio TaxID=7955 RepID=F1R8M8_DANRE|nr:ribosomal L1 domain-containing protein 1 [Danio rerio]|eukprot:NP_001313639.1 ribosomal L1 domain-containing protein 1 [Danio rerio]
MLFLLFRHTCSMETPRDELTIDQSQVKKAAQALQAFIKNSTSSQKLFQNDGQPISLLFTLWKIPKKEQTIRIPLSHGLRTESGDVCLFTRDEPNMTAEQTERFYKKLLTERGVKNVTEVIPFKALRTEYKPFEAKRKLLGNFDLFLSDARIRFRLPSQIGKHFYERKKAPLSVDLESKHLARDMERLIQGTTLTVSTKGPCCMARVAHSEMTADQIVENVISAVSTISAKLASTGKNIKIIHLKSQTSVALPIYTSDLSHLALVEEAQKKARLTKGAQKRKRKTENTEAPKPVTKETEEEKDSEEEIPQLVPIETPKKKTKREGLSKKGLKKVPKPAAGNSVKKSVKDKKLVKKTPKRTERGLEKKKLKTNKT